MLLERFFAWLDRRLGEPAPSGVVSAPVDWRPSVPVESMPSARDGTAGEPLPWACVLSVDDGGRFLLADAPRLTLGHLRAARADLCFLADVGGLHAELLREDSLQAGPGWRIASIGSELVRVAGQRVGPEGRRLAAGELVHLGANLEFRLHQPDPSSASASLELLHAVECEGARQILLLGTGSGGRLRIGSALAHHVRVPNLEGEIQLEKHGAELWVRSDFPLTGPEVRGETCRLPFPPRARVQLSSGAARGPRPAFAFTLEPVERGARR